MRRIQSSLVVLAGLASGCDGGDDRAPSAPAAQEDRDAAAFGQRNRAQYPGGIDTGEAPAAAPGPAEPAPMEPEGTGVGGGLLGTGIGSGSGGVETAPEVPPVRDPTGVPVVRTEPDAGGPSATGAILPRPGDPARPAAMVVGEVVKVDGDVLVLEDAAGGFHQVTLTADTRRAGEGAGRMPAAGDAVRVEYVVQGERRIARVVEKLQPPRP